MYFLCSSFTRADFRTICATGTAVGWRCPACHPQSKTGFPAQTSPLVTTSASPPPGFPPIPLGFYQSRSPRGPPRYPCFMCSLEVGNDSLKCSTCSKWVHFSCSSLTRADFRKICAAGSPMRWNFPAVSVGTLPLPPTSKRPTVPSLQLRPHPHPLPLTCSDLMDSSLPLPSHPTLLHPTFHTTHTHTTNSQLAATPSTNSMPPSQSQNSAMECRRFFLLPSC